MAPGVPEHREMGEPCPHAARPQPCHVPLLMLSLSYHFGWGQTPLPWGCSWGQPPEGSLMAAVALPSGFAETSRTAFPLLPPADQSPSPSPIWGIPPSRLRDMVYRLLEERSKKGAGRSMRALACRVCACVRPL